MSDESKSTSIPVVEETLTVGRREVETGRVRIRTVADEQTVMATDRLLHSDVQVQRVPINREVAELPVIREEGELLIVPVVEERLVKRLFLVEEVRVQRQVITEEFNHPVKLRSQRVVVERQEERGGSHKE